MTLATRRLGKYELQESLGRGGMAEVWKASDTQLHRYVAIKVLHANLQTDPDFVTRFIREAQLVAALRHPNIVQIYDFHIAGEGEADADTIAYMVMEYIKGQTLAQYLSSTSRQRNFPPAATLVGLLAPISLAIDYAHQQGTIHRDIKPANILLDQSNKIHHPMGEPILSDFGIAKVLGAKSQTISGAVSGTPLYISPEQVQDQPVSDRTDLYALGVVCYEMFTGTPPFRGETLASIMMKHLTEAPPAPHLVNPALPPALSAVLLKSLAKDPADRFPSACAMTAALATAFNLPIPQDVQQAILPDISHMPTRENLLSSAMTLLPSQAAESANDFETAAGPSSAAGEPTVRSSPFLPQAAFSQGNRGMVQQDAVSSDQAIFASTPAPALASYAPPSPSTPIPALPARGPVAPAPNKQRGLRIALVILLLCVLAGSGLGAFFLLAHHTPPAATSAPAVVGQALFVSSGQVDMTTNEGSMDELQINLHNIPNPAAGKSYYAWLLPDIKNVEAADILLGKLSVNQGVIHFLYQGDSQHMNLLAITSRFLITEEASNVTPDIPSPNLSDWKYYVAIPQTPAPGQQYSLLDHLRHLLAVDRTFRQFTCKAV